MRLRTRVFLTVAVAAMLSGAIAYLGIERVLARSYLALEQDMVRTETARVRNTLLGGLQPLAASTADWANWDELHASLAQDPAIFARANLVPLTFTGLEVHCIAVLTNAGALHAGACHEPHADALQPPGAARLTVLQAMQRVMQESGQDRLSAVIALPEGPQLAAAQVVRPLAQDEASRGIIVLTRALDSNYAARLAEMLQRDVALLSPAEAPPGRSESLWVDLGDDQHARGYFRLDALDGTPALVGRTVMPRTIRAQAGDALALVALVIVLVALLAPVAAEYGIDRLVVSRIRRLRDWAGAVAAGGALAAPQGDTGGADEIGELARSVGGMARHLDGVQKELELAREQADRSNRAKSEFLAGASHEIRTPLTAILGYAELLQDRRLSDAEYFQYLNTIRHNGEDLLGILNDILDLSKVEAGRLDLSWEKTDVQAVIAGVIDLLGMRAGQRGLTLAAEGLEELPARVFIDPARFRQILVNLVGNAIRYTDRGHIVVRCRVQRDNPVNARLEIEVQDTGIGMDAVQQARLFQPFTQLGHGSARRAGGTGLGLALSQEFARAMGGLIRVRSAPGEGSTFTLELPVGDITGVPAAGRPAAAAAAAPAEGDDEPFPGRRVLLVEDNPVNCLLVEKLLERLQVSVSTEVDGLAALERVLRAGETFDLVLLDMQLPSLDGYAVVHRLRAADYRGVVVALTASAMAGERERALRAGCDDFIAKPLQTRAFLHTCRAWLRRGPAR